MYVAVVDTAVFPTNLLPNSNPIFGNIGSFCQNCPLALLYFKECKAFYQRNSIAKTYLIVRFKPGKTANVSLTFTCRLRHTHLQNQAHNRTKLSK
jgi:hypothetical protein